MRPIIFVACLLLITGSTQAQEEIAPTTFPETHSEKSLPVGNVDNPNAEQPILNLKENLQRAVVADSSSEKELIDGLQQLEELLKRDDVKALLQQKAQPCTSCPLHRRTSRHLQLRPTGRTRDGFRTRPRSIASQQRFPRRVQISGGIPTWLRPYLTQDLTPGYVQVVTAANSGWHENAVAYADYGHGTLHLIHPRIRARHRVVRMQALDDCPNNTPYDIQEYEQTPETYETSRVVRRLVNPQSQHAFKNLLNGWTRVRHGAAGNAQVPGRVTATRRGMEVVLNRVALTNAQRRHRISARHVSGR